MRKRVPECFPSISFFTELLFLKKFHLIRKKPETPFLYQYKSLSDDILGQRVSPLKNQN